MLGYCPVAGVRGKGKAAPSRRKEPSLVEPDGSGAQETGLSKSRLSY